MDIPAVVEDALAKFDHCRPQSLSEVHVLDSEARRVAIAVINNISKRNI